MVECGLQDLIREILEREKLAYREPVVDTGFQDTCHYLESVSSQEVSCGKHKRVKIKSIGLFLLEKVGSTETHRLFLTRRYWGSNPSVGEKTESLSSLALVQFS